uniref:Uncharacterized protein n=1 Tax=Cucumis melo TaxID=3656 RepID=A0A9I9E8X0_CUCME
MRSVFCVVVTMNSTFVKLLRRSCFVYNSGRHRSHILSIFLYTWPFSGIFWFMGVLPLHFVVGSSSSNRLRLISIPSTIS